MVADSTRTEKTICLAVTPSLKAYGLSGRSRLYEVIRKVKAINEERKQKIPLHMFIGKSFDANILNQNPSYALDYIIAPPRMAFYIEYSTKIYNIYLQYVAPEDIHVYSIDEVFIDATTYLATSHMTPETFARQMIRDIYYQTGITATGGIGSNLYLAKVAMDIVAKHMEPDENGVRIAELTELSYRKLLWIHTPLTDFWRVGKGYAKKLEAVGIYTMGDIARCSLGKDTDYFNSNLLYRLFGINAELLIDHAWGREPCTLKEVKAYRPTTNSLCSGQVLQNPYDFEQTELVIKEMVDLFVLDLVEKRLVTDQIVLTIGYDIVNLQSMRNQKAYRGEITEDAYGRKIPKHAQGTTNFSRPTSSTHEILEATLKLYQKISNPDLFVRRITITANHVVPETLPILTESEIQLNFFEDPKEHEKQKNEQKKERCMQEAMLHIKKKYGKNSILKAMNLQEGATAKDRNQQIGGHKA